MAVLRAVSVHFLGSHMQHTRPRHHLTAQHVHRNCGEREAAFELLTDCMLCTLARSSLAPHYEKRVAPSPCCMHTSWAAVSRLRAHLSPA